MTRVHRLTAPFLLSTVFAVGCGQSASSPDPTGGTSGTSGGVSAGGAAAGGAATTIAGGTVGTGAGPATGGSPAAGVGGTGGAGTAGSDSTGGSSGGGTVAGGAGTVGGAGGASAGGGPPTTTGLNAGAGVWGTPQSGGPAHSGTSVTGTVTVNRASVAGNVGAGFAGFSMEKSHLTNGSLTGTNASMIGLFKLIGPTTLRIGADDVDTSTWVPATKPGTGGPPYGSKIGTAMVDQLADFIKASGAKLIYGVNFKLNDVANTTAEATYANMMLGASIDGFEIGNEINKYGTWAAQKTQWESFGTSIINAVPSAKLIGPATTSGGSENFATPFAADESAKFGDKLTLLTQHYYVAGATSSGATVAALQTVPATIDSIAATMKTAASKNKIPNGWRMGETNSYSGHGKQGISDTLIASLWSIDFMFHVALNGGSGINFHGAETGMDGTNPFYYEPIMENNGMVSAVMPMYYGMLFFYLAGQGQVLATSVTSSNANFSAYALDYKGDGSTSVVLVNKNANTGVDATIDAGSAVTSASAIYLQGTPAGSVTAAANTVTLAGSAVTTAGAWARQAPYTQTVSGNTVSVFVPPATAALVRVQ